jgi:hypothetical protein
VTVAASAGSTAVTGSSGRFCLGAPAQQSVTVFADGYFSATVETGGFATCPVGCAEVDLVPLPDEVRSLEPRAVAPGHLP